MKRKRHREIDRESREEPVQSGSRLSGGSHLHNQAEPLYIRQRFSSTYYRALVQIYGRPGNEKRHDVQSSVAEKKEREGEERTEEPTSLGHEEKRMS